MPKQIPISKIIKELEKLPEGTKLTVDTKNEVQIIGVILERKDDKAKVAVPFSVPKKTPLKK